MAYRASIKRFGTMKPGRGARLNRGHQLARGLRVAFLGNQYGGIPVNAVTQNSATSMHSETVWTPAGVLGNSRINVDFGTDTRIVPQQAFSFAVKMRLPAVPPETNSLVHFTDAAAAQVQYPGILAPFTANRPLMYLGAENYRYFNDISAFYGVWSTFVFTIPGSAMSDISSAALYVNGSAWTFYTTSDWQEQSARSRVEFGAPAGAINGSVGEWAWAYLYDRALTAAEAAWLTAEPFSMMQSPSPRTLVAFSSTQYQTTFEARMYDFNVHRLA